MNKNEQNQGQQAQGFAGARSGSQPIDARYGETPEIVQDRLRTAMRTAVDGDFLVIGQKSDGSPFLWSTADNKDKTTELAKLAAPELVGLVGSEHSASFGG
jgi:hypothetical protein